MPDSIVSVLWSTYTVHKYTRSVAIREHIPTSTRSAERANQTTLLPPRWLSSHTHAIFSTEVKFGLVLWKPLQTSNM